ncbi:MAG: hypothetical protein C5B55_06020 [Blastocatellia bacterium]|nr:MAG: hypothetical protein C5B55_06020 [Blastocatellia bacterium]
MTARAKLIGISFVCGLIINSLLTITALMGNSRTWLCVFAWQACLVQIFIHTPDNPIHEASPIDLFGFIVGILLGVPIYAGLCYLALKAWQSSEKFQAD